MEDNNNNNIVVVPNPNFKENEIHVRIVDEEDIVDISYILNNKLTIMNRPKDEGVDKTIKRLISNYKKTETTKKKKKNNSPMKTKSQNEISYSVQTSDEINKLDDDFKNGQLETGLSIIYYYYF